MVKVGMAQRVVGSDLGTAGSTLVLYFKCYLAGSEGIKKPLTTSFQWQ